MVVYKVFRYLKHLQDSINNSREISIKEFYNTDLNNSSNIEEIMTWYDSIIALVTETPPSYYVKTIILIENKDGIIESVEYVYYKKNEEICDSTFIYKKE